MSLDIDASQIVEINVKYFTLLNFFYILTSYTRSEKLKRKFWWKTERLTFQIIFYRLESKWNLPHYAFHPLLRCDALSSGMHVCWAKDHCESLLGEITDCVYCCLRTKILVDVIICLRCIEGINDFKIMIFLLLSNEFLHLKRSLLEI